MKKTHLILLVIAAVIAVSSAYSLAALNQVYSIDYDWFSQYNGRFTGEHRETSMDTWKLQTYPEKMIFRVVDSREAVSQMVKSGLIKENPAAKIDYKKYFLLYCTLGEVYSPDFRIKVTGIAQRGSMVEVRVSVNSPSKLAEAATITAAPFTAADSIRIERSALPSRGKLYFVFKNQEGIKLYECHMDIN